MRRLRSVLGVSAVLTLVACGAEKVADTSNTGAVNSSATAGGAASQAPGSNSAPAPGSPSNSAGAPMPSVATTTGGGQAMGGSVPTSGGQMMAGTTPTAGAQMGGQMGGQMMGGQMMGGSTATPPASVTTPVGSVTTMPTGTAMPPPAGTGLAPAKRPSVVVSSEGKWWTEGTAMEATGNADVTIDDTKPAQKWLGMGGAFNEKGWEALSVVDATERDKAVQALFGAEGARFVQARIPIGASDYAISRYTLDDNKDDYDMAKFSIEHDQKYLLPYVKAAIAINPSLQLTASAWTPPGWMKSNGTYDKGTMKSDEKTLKAYALYLARFVEDYKKEGVTVNVVYPQNEPGYEQDYPSCGWDSATFTTFIGKYLGPLFDERKVGAEIWCGTMSNSEKDTATAKAVAADATAMKYVKGFGLQWGAINALSSLKGKNLPMWQSEHQAGNYPFSPTLYGGSTWNSSTDFNSSKAPNDHRYAEEGWRLIKEWLKQGANGYAAWNMVLDTNGLSLDSVRPWPQNALIVVDKGAKKVIYTPSYYVFKHISYYTDPGGTVVSATGDALGFKNPDGSVVGVVYNSGSSAKDVTVSVLKKTYKVNIPAGGWASVYAK